MKFERLLYLIEILHQTTTIEVIQIVLFVLYLIEILHQTTTLALKMIKGGTLYLIEILHQTTTTTTSTPNATQLYLIEILHQTTTCTAALRILPRCILSKFYIKPQLLAIRLLLLGVVSYRNSTSNHNFMVMASLVPELYLIEILHQTTTPPYLWRETG